MILRIILTTLCIFLVSMLPVFSPKKPFWFNLGAALVLSLLNAMIFSILKFLANAYIWIVYGVTSVLLNLIILVLLEKWFNSDAERKYMIIFVFALTVSIISSAGYWLI